MHTFHAPGAQELASLLDGDPAIAALFASPPAEADLAALVRDLGLDVPAAFHDLYRIADGTAKSADGTEVVRILDDDGVVVHSLAGVAKWKSFWDELTRGYAAMGEDERGSVFHYAFWHPAWIPIAMGIEDVYAVATEPCFGGPAGQVVRFPCDGGTRWTIASDSLDDFLGLIAAAIAGGARRLDRETLLALNPGARYVELIPGEAGRDRFERPAKRLADELSAPVAARPPLLAARIAEVASARGVEVDELRASVVGAVEAAAREVFGEGRRVEAMFDEGTGEIALYLVATVVERVERPGLELSIEGVQAELDPTSAVGEEIMLQVFYLEGQETLARETERSQGALFALDDAYRSALDRFRALAPEVVEGALRRG